MQLGHLGAAMNSSRERWLQLALVVVCAALEEVECTDEAPTEALFVGMPGLKIDDITAAAVAEALRRASTLKEAAATLDRSRGFIYDSLKRRRQDWMNADWAAYGAELRRRRLLAGWSVAELSRRINLSPPIIYQIEQGRGRLRPSELTRPSWPWGWGCRRLPPAESSTTGRPRTPPPNRGSTDPARHAHTLPALWAGASATDAYPLTT